MTETKRIRNFSIIAHIDHGKSTLADQFLLKTGAITARDFRNQVLDDMDLERERGITIQMHPVTIYHQLDGETYELNLIDTPGHVDFSYEVSRSLAACEGVILLVDAFQGVQAQTVANAYLAMESELTIVPVLNKIDLEIARPDAVIAEMQSALGIEPEDVLRASGKSGLGIDEVLRAIVQRVPPPPGDPASPLKALVYNSHFDTYKGVVVYVRVKEGVLRKGQRIRLMLGATEHEVTEMGQFRPAMTPCEELSTGQVGYFMAQIKTLSDVHIGDTVTDALHPAEEPLPGYKEPQPMVFSGLYPVNNNDFESLRKALAKLKLNDSSFTYQPEVSEGLGFGFRCGFLGMLHREIIQQRLERDSDLDLVQTAPNVTYEILTRKGETLVIDSPQKVPDAGQIEEFREPFVRHQFPAAGREHRRPDADVRRAARPVRAHRVPQSDAGDPRLRDAVGGNHLRPVRQAEVGDARLRHDGLRLFGLSLRRPGATRRARPSQSGRCALDHSSSRHGRPARAQTAQETARGDRSPPV